jgi:hypothetical protein
MGGMDKQPENCASCDFETSALQQYPLRMGQPGLWLCELCAGTPAGNAAAFPEQHGDDGNLLATICYVGNVLLAEIRKQR